ncbi:MAG: CBS domain-containing protein [Actinomycetota bacterium]|nr:CBS domain-containing protein [Actinomycetota bacterium]
MTGSDPSAAPFHGPEASVQTYLTSEVVTIAVTASVREAAAELSRASVGVLVIGTADVVAGLVSERDVVRAVAEGRDPDGTLAIDVGTTTLIWIDAGNTIGDAAEEMMEDYVRHVLVRGDDGLVGILSMRDVLDAYIT